MYIHLYIHQVYMSFEIMYIRLYIHGVYMSFDIYVFTFVYTLRFSLMNETF